MQYICRFLLVLEVIDGGYLRLWYAVVSWFVNYVRALQVRILQMMLQHDVALSIRFRMGHSCLEGSVDIELRK